MTGTIVNGAAIVLGGLAGLLIKNHISSAIQQRFRLAMGLLIVFVGMSMFLKAMRDTPDHRFPIILIILVSLVAGNLIGKALGIQKRMDQLGAVAKRTYEKRGDESSARFTEGFVTCAILFCVGPMAIVGAMDDGLYGNSRTLFIKAVMDGVSTLFFVSTFGWGPIFAALPVMVYQGSISLIARLAQPEISNLYIKNAMYGAGGLLIVCVSVVVFDVKKVPIADYLPSLAVAPFLAWLFFG